MLSTVTITNPILPLARSLYGLSALFSFLPLNFTFLWHKGSVSIQTPRNATTFQKEHGTITADEFTTVVRVFDRDIYFSDFEAGGCHISEAVNEFTPTGNSIYIPYCDEQWEHSEVKFIGKKWSKDKTTRWFIKVSVYCKVFLN